jgi:hypothetical protein
MVGSPCDFFFNFLLIKRILNCNFVFLGILMTKINENNKFTVIKSLEIQIKIF